MSEILLDMRIYMDNKSKYCKTCGAIKYELDPSVAQKPHVHPPVTQNSSFLHNLRSYVHCLLCPTPYICTPNFKRINHVCIQTKCKSASFHVFVLQNINQNLKNIVFVLNVLKQVINKKNKFFKGLWIWWRNDD
jgi:hypothetical protein